MLGWINDCVEKLVISKFGLDAWHSIKEKAGCKVPDGGFYKLDVYTDKSTVDLVVAATEVSGLSTEVVLETFGAFFVEYVRDEGYENLLLCQGSNLKDFMANINAMHQHLQDTFPKKMIMPQFWVEDDESGDGSLVLHYNSKRGSLLAAVAKGVVVQIASSQFGYDIEMKRLRTQGEDGADFTSWRITTVDPKDMWKLAMKEQLKAEVKSTPKSTKCPFTGMTFNVPSGTSRSCPYGDANPSRKRTRTAASDPTIQQSAQIAPSINPVGQVEEGMSDQESHMDPETHMLSKASAVTPSCASGDEVSCVANAGGIGLSPKMTKSVFPYHVMVDADFRIAQVGKKLPTVLGAEEGDLIGRDLEDVFLLTKPGGVKWNWKWLELLEGQAFEVEPKDAYCSSEALYTFKTTVIHLDAPCMAMLVMTPEAHNLQDLRDMKLTFSDLPLHGDHRESIFLREHLSSQMNSALKLEKLSRSLEMEKTLLESMLPTHAAEGLRRGETVEPMLHDKTTFFFSDIVGFTKICNQLYPWEVIEMLNRLYCVMDFLAGTFNLYKVETIGDAYVCASGLPTPDKEHARNVANFAIAVSHCTKQVLSPADGSPIQLRIGVHTGACASGVVGSTNPRYCVFGDTVNTTARHESSGSPGKVHCSATTQSELESKFQDSFTLKKRGLVKMKGKGYLTTYWLEAHKNNSCINRAGLAKLDKQISDLLERTNFKTIRTMSLSDSNGNLIERQAPPELKTHLSYEEMKSVGFLNNSFRAKERHRMKSVGTLNVDWGNAAMGNGKKKQSRCGTSLLDAVDRCSAASVSRKPKRRLSMVEEIPPALLGSLSADASCLLGSLSSFEQAAKSCDH